MKRNIVIGFLSFFCFGALSLAQAADAPEKAAPPSTKAPAVSAPAAPGASAKAPVAPAATAKAPAAPVTPAVAESAKSGTVEKIEVGTAVEERELVGAATAFEASTATRVYCWMRAGAAEPPVTLHHVWLLDGQKQSDVPLTIKSASMRTWSYHDVVPGTWKVEVTDDAGAVLSSVDFTVNGEAKSNAAEKP
jgi:hypothetical protein